jgi:hypothetical protein
MNILAQIVAILMNYVAFLDEIMYIHTKQAVLCNITTNCC